MDVTLTEHHLCRGRFVLIFNNSSFLRSHWRKHASWAYRNISATSESQFISIEISLNRLLKTGQICCQLKGWSWWRWNTN